MPQAEDPGLAAIEAYLRWANQFAREGFIALRSGRPEIYEDRRVVSEMLRRAAKAERVNPPVALWPSSNP